MLCIESMQTCVCYGCCECRRMRTERAAVDTAAGLQLGVIWVHSIGMCCVSESRMYGEQIGKVIKCGTECGQS